jgi:hypothetical protein
MYIQKLIMYIQTSLSVLFLLFYVLGVFIFPAKVMLELHSIAG